MIVVVLFWCAYAVCFVCGGWLFRWFGVGCLVCILLLLVLGLCLCLVCGCCLGALWV